MTITNHFYEKNQEGPVGPEEVLEIFRNLGMPHSVFHHPPVFRVAESHKIEQNIPGAHVRNLFLKDHKGRMFLVTLRQETKVDLKKLATLLKAGRFSFASADRLWNHLGVKPGSVTPLAIINDTGRDVTLVLEHGMMQESLVNMHPLVNTMTVGMTPSTLMHFLEKHGITPQIIDLTPAAPEEE